jgi:hypothetical protein
VPTHGVDPMVLRHPLVVVEGSEQGEAGSRPVDHRERHRAIERDHGSRRDPFEDLVQRQDLRPVRLVGARRFVVHRGDRGLELVGTDRRRAEGAGDERYPLLDLSRVPEIASLFGERNEGAIRVRPGSAPGIGQQHEGEQAGDLAFLWEQLVKHARQPDGLGREVGPLERRARARRVALVEDEVEHVQDHAEAVGPLRLRGRVESDAGAPDALLGAADALGHRGLGNQEGVRDLSRRQPADRTQRECELRRHGERGVAAEEQQRERVVPVGRPLAG